MLTGLFVASILLSSVLKADEYGRPFYASRSQGANLPHAMVMSDGQEGIFGMEELYGKFDILGGYGRTWKSDKIGKYLSLKSDNDTMTIGATSTDGTNTIAAVNLGLSPDAAATLKLAPKKEDIFFDFGAFVGFDEYVEGLWLKLRLPVVRTKWNLGGDLTVTSAGTAVANYFQTGATPATVPAAPTEEQLLAGEFTCGYLDTKQTHAKFYAGDKIETALTDVAASIGWNFIRKDKGFFGLYIHGLVPTGTRPTAEFVFEPIAGNGRHFEIGGGLVGKACLWENDNEEQKLCFNVDARATHMWKATQKRTFDLTANGKGSRYLLLKEFVAAGTFADKLVRGPNVLTLDAKIKVNVQFEGAAMFTYHYKGLTADLGYNLWGRTKEEVSEFVDTIAADKYGIYAQTTANCNATGNLDDKTASTATISNSAVAADVTANVYISNDSLDKDGSCAPSALTHTVFANLGYCWDENEWKPFVGLGGNCEFCAGNKAFDQWSVWGKLGFSF